MRKVHDIPRLVFLLGILLTACATDSPSFLPPMEPAVRHTPAPVVKHPPRPRGFVEDTRTGIFHREGCPRIREIPPACREYYADPWEAINHHCSPCGYCEPLAGWK